MNSRADQSARLRLALRKQRGRMLAPGMLKALSRAMGEPLSAGNLLTLEQTDFLFGIYSVYFQACLSGEKPHLHLRVPPGKASAVSSQLAHVGTLPGARVVFFGRDFEYTGAVEMPAPWFLGAEESLLRLEAGGLRGPA